MAATVIRAIRGGSGLVWMGCVVLVLCSSFAVMDWRAASAKSAGSCLGKPVTIPGTSGNDDLRGSDDDDVILAKGGNDDIDGKGGDDRICAGGGNDHIDAGSGRDQVSGGGGADKINAVDGDDDVINGGKGADTCKTDPSDTVKSCASAAPECSDGDDNDSDGKVDTDDPGCSDSSDDSESPDPSEMTADLVAADVLTGPDTNLHYTYQFTFVNNGPSAAAAPTVTIGLPSNFTVTSIPSHCTQTDATVACTETTDLPAGEKSDSAIVEGFFTSSAQASFSGSVDSETLDPDTANNSDSTTVTPPQCADGEDNDSDTQTDYPDDPDCASASDDSESVDVEGSVTASAETEPVPHSGDAADDAAIWIHPTDRSKSEIITTDKLGGLAVYNLSGEQLHYYADGRPNNVDLRYNFPLGSDRATLVAASDRELDAIRLYQVDESSGELRDVAARTISTGHEPYGLCMYHSATSGKYYVFENDTGGVVQQWELSHDGSGKVDARMVRSFDVGTQTEGCVADDELGRFYVGEEDVAIWRYGAEPTDGDTRTEVDGLVGAGGHLTDDIEGLTLYYASDGTGYLLASSQGSDDYAVYTREGSNAYVGRFSIAPGDVDGTSGTDGIDVTNAPLGGKFSEGLFVAQDNVNTAPSANQNFKLVPWSTIARAAQPDLKIDTKWDPRGVGAAAGG